MLELAGYVLPARNSAPDAVAPDADRLRAMTQGREQLRSRTDEDCGYDLRRWHEVLLSGGLMREYKHPYA